MSNVNGGMSIRELRVFEEWGAAPSQMGSSPPGLPSQPQGQANRQVSGQTQPRDQASVPIQNQRQLGSQQRKPSLGQSQGYAFSKVSTNGIRGNGTTLVVPSGQVLQSQAQSRGRVQDQRYDTVSVDINDKPMDLALNRPVNPNASFLRQTLPNQVQDQAAGGHATANPCIQMQAQGKVSGKSLRQDQRCAPESIAPGVNANGNSSAQISQTTHKRYPMGRNKRRNRGPTVFDEWKAQATKDDAVIRDKSKQDESEVAITAAIDNSSTKLKDIVDEWTIGTANAGQNASISDEVTIPESRKDSIGQSHVDLASKKDECPEGSKGRSGRRRNSRRHKDRSGPGNDKTNEKESNLSRRRRRETAGSSGGKPNLRVDSHAQKGPVESVSLSAAPYASNTASGQGGNTNDPQKNTRSRKSCSFSSDGPKFATIGEDNVSGGLKADILDKKAIPPSESIVDEQKKSDLELNLGGEKSDVCEWSKDVPAGATPTSLGNPEIDQVRKDNALKISCLPEASSILAATENTANTLRATELSASSEAAASNRKEHQSAMATASEVEHDCLSRREQVPIRCRQRSTKTASPASNRSSSTNFRSEIASHVAQSKRNCSGQHDPPQQDGYLAPCGKRISKIMLNRLAEGIKYPSRGTTVYFLPSFVEDPWEGLKPMKIERPDDYRALVDEAMED